MEHSSFTDESPNEKNFRKLKTPSKNRGHGICITFTVVTDWKKPKSVKAPPIAIFRAGVAAAAAIAAMTNGASTAKDKTTYDDSLEAHSLHIFESSM